MTRFLKHHVRAIVVIGVAACVTGAGTVAIARPDPPALQRGEHQRAQRQAFREQGLRAAAAVNGSYRTAVRYPTDGGPASLEELVTLSDRIVVARTSANVCRPTRDGRMIVTLYDLTVEETLKGKPNAVALAMILLGGQVRFDNGATARIDTPGFSRPTQPLRRIFFLRAAPPELTGGNEWYLEGKEALVPVAGPLGVYDLSQSRGLFVHPAGNYTNPLAVTVRLAKLAPDRFITEVRRVLASVAR